MGILSKLAPKLAAKRAYWNQVENHYAGGYDGAKDTRYRKGHMWRGVRQVDEDHQIGSYDRGRLRLECKDLHRNNAIVAGVTERFADNIVGTGITPQAKTSDEAWNEQAEMFWREWSKIVDSRGRMNMRQLQRQLVMSRLIDGEAGAVLLRNGQLQPVEAERIVTPKGSTDDRIVDGVQLAASGRPVAFYVGPRDKHGSVDSNNPTRVTSNDFIHCPRYMRFDQVRGIPDLAPVINSIRDFGELNEATINKAKLDAMQAWFIQTESGAGAIGKLGPRDVTPDNNNVGMRHEASDMGTIHYGKPGESMTSLASNTPNGQYVNFTQLILHIIGSAIGIPYQFLLLDFSNGSFSSSRAALMQTFKTFESWQSWMTDCFLRRTWNWRIAKAIRDGDLPPAPMQNGHSEWYKVNWSYPEYGWIDPKSEVQSQIMEYNLGISSVTDFAQKKGKDGTDVLKRKGMDIAEAIRVADEINADKGTNITWRDLISVQIPGQVTRDQATEGNNENE